MRSITLVAIIAVFTVASACGESKEPESKKTDPAASKTSSTTDAEKIGETKTSPNTKQKQKQTLECEQWLSADLVKTHCGVELPLESTKTSPTTATTCSRQAKAENGSRLSISFEKLRGATIGSTIRRLYPDPPKLVKRPTTNTIKGRNFPFLLTVATISTSGKPVCTDEQAMALTKAVLAKLPATEEPPGKENKACDALLTADDIKATCKKEGRVTPSMMEDGKTLYCNRSGSGLIFIVSKHASDDLAERGAKVAREDTAAGVAHKGPFSIEMKSSAGSNTCNKAALDALAKLVAERL